MDKITSFLERLGFWPFVLLFTLIAALFGGLLIFVQSCWFPGTFDNLLIIGLTSAALFGFLTLIFLAILMPYLITIRKRLLELQKVAHIGFWELDIKHNRLQWSDEVYRIFGFTPGEFEASYEAFLNYVHPEDREMLDNEYRISLAEKREYHITHRIIQANGTMRYVEEKCRHFYDEEGNAFKSIGSVYDITERKHTQTRLNLMAKVFTESYEGIFITDERNRIVDVNKAFTHITGYARNEILGKEPNFLKSSRHDDSFYAQMRESVIHHGVWQGELWNTNKDGKEFAVHLTISTVQNDQGQIQNYIGIFVDTTFQNLQRKELEYNAYYDSLTDLPNRLLMADRMQQAMNQTIRRHEYIALAYLDLDGFKNVNDTYGHQVGDKLLIYLADKMKNILRKGDTIARLGGDEFLIMMVDLSEKNALNPLIDRLLELIRQPTTIDEHTVQVKGSIGVTFYPQEKHVSYEELINQADEAMYQAKSLGKNRFSIYQSEA